ncbi:MAG: hypothetical protein J6Y11_02980 [Paludibacteraceae bacterium]|nr:hypothetical protein [Paludibacteraceae bacterium]
MKLKKILFTVLFLIPFCCYALEGKGTVKDPYKVGNAEDLDELSDMVNGLNGKTPITKEIHVVQVSDIVYNESLVGTKKAFMPIGMPVYVFDGYENYYHDKTFYFKGSYDGNGYTIKGLYVYQKQDDLNKTNVDTLLYGYAGLFGCVNSATIKNVKIEDALFEVENVCGAVVGQSESSEIINCTVKNTTITKSGIYYNSNLGGICGRTLGTSGCIDGCSFEGTIKGNENIGGICGYSECVFIKNCEARGVILGSYEKIIDEYGYDDSQAKPTVIGGIVGFSSSDITSCTNYCEVSGDGIVAGICGSAKDASIKACKNYGNILGSYDLAGIVGMGDTYSDVFNCANYGDVIGDDHHIGGIVGNANVYLEHEYAVDVHNSINYGKIKGTKTVGGIGGTTICYSCMNFGSVEGIEYVGGIVGHGIPRNCINNSRVSGEKHTGAICGATTCPNSYEKRVNYYNSDSCKLAGCEPVDCTEPFYFDSLPTFRMVGPQAFSAMSKLVANGEFYTAVDSVSKILYYPNVLALKGLVDPVGIAVDWTYENGFDDEHSAYEMPVFKGNTYEIANAGQLYWFANFINQSDTNCFVNAKLVNDIVINDNIFDENGNLTKDSLSLRKWLPIGVRYVVNTNDSRYYQGSFDGQGHSIKGIYFNDPKAIVSDRVETGVGFFGTIKNGVVKNVNLVDCYFKCESFVGGLACYAGGTVIDSCSVSGYIYTTGSLVSGFVCSDAKKISNCTNYATVIQDQNYSDWLGSYGTHSVMGAAGIGPADTIANCTNNGNILGYYNVAGIAQHSTGGLICNCVNNADSIKGYMNTGGICSLLNGSTISDCVNNGTILGRPSGSIGGINAKSDKKSTIIGCTNNGEIIIRGDCYDVGGIAGNNSANLYKCKNNGNISSLGGSSPSSLGGIVGSNYSEIIDECLNKGSISSTGHSVGGIVGTTSGYNIINCFNYGDIKGEETVGGICGQFMNNSNLNIVYCANYGNIDGDEFCGGVAGDGFRGKVKCSYNRGNVNSKEYSGGLIGSLTYASVNDCYNAGEVIGQKYTAGLIGKMSGDTITNCYNIGKCSDNIYGAFGDYESCLINNIYLNSDSCVAHLSKADSSVINIDSLITMNMVGTNAPSFMPSLDFENVWYVAPDEEEKFYYPHLLVFKNITEAPYVNLNNTCVDECFLSNVLTYSVDNHIFYMSDDEIEVSVISVDGKIVKNIRCDRGLNDLGFYNRGIYIVNGRTVIVR